MSAAHGAPARGRPRSPSSSSTSRSSAGPSTCCSRSCCAKRSTCSSSQLAEVVLAYLDHLEQRGELDLEAATEFIVLIAALLELKSRLMLGGEERGAARHRAATRPPRSCWRGCSTRAATARRRPTCASCSPREDGVRFRAAPLPPRAAPDDRAARRRLAGPALLGAAIGRLLQMPPEIDLRHIAVAAGVARRAPRAPARAAAARRLRLRRGGERRRPHDRRGDAVRAARALQAGRGRLGARSESFGEIRVSARGVAARRGERGRSRWRPAGARARVDERRRAQSSRSSPARSRRCCSSPPTRSAAAELADAAAGGRGRRAGRARAARRATTRPGGAGIALRELGGGWTLASDPASRGRRAPPVQPPAHRRADARAGRDARDRRLPAAGLAPGDHPHPRRLRRLGRPPRCSSAG